jgi:hypothetical protein
MAAWLRNNGNCTAMVLNNLFDFAAIVVLAVSPPPPHPHLILNKLFLRILHTRCLPDALEDLETSLSKHFINPRVLRAARGKDDAQKYINDLDKDLGKKEFWTPVRRFLHQFLEGLGLCHASLSLVVPTKYSFAIVSSLSAIVCWVVPRDTLLERE